MSLLGFGKNKVSPVKNPFAKSQITDVFIRAYKSPWRDTWTFYSTVEFKNGDTEGKQKIIGESMNDVIAKTDAFVTSLE